MRVDLLYAVLADQGVDLTGVQGQVHVVQGPDAGEGLAQSADGEHFGRGCHLCLQDAMRCVWSDAMRR